MSPCMGVCVPTCVHGCVTAGFVSGVCLAHGHGINLEVISPQKLVNELLPFVCGYMYMQCVFDKPVLKYTS